VYAPLGISPRLLPSGCPITVYTPLNQHVDYNITIAKAVTKWVSHNGVRTTRYIAKAVAKWVSHNGVRATQPACRLQRNGFAELNDDACGKCKAAAAELSAPYPHRQAKLWVSHNGVHTPQNLQVSSGAGHAEQASGRAPTGLPCRPPPAARTVPSPCRRSWSCPTPWQTRSTTLVLHKVGSENA